MLNKSKIISLAIYLLLATTGASSVYASTTFSIDGDITFGSAFGLSSGVVTDMGSGTYDETSFTTANIDDGIGGIGNVAIKIYDLTDLLIDMPSFDFDFSMHAGVSAPTIAFNSASDDFVYIEYAGFSGVQNFLSISDIGHSFNGTDSSFGFMQGEWVIDSFATSAVPVPAAVWLFGSGLLGLLGVARRNKA